jgi:hypothetical protein
LSDDKEIRIDELIYQLNVSDRYIDLDLLQEILAQGEAAVDRLIEVLEHDDDWAQVHALLLLIEMRAEKALPLISHTLLEYPDLNEWVDTSGLDKFGPVAIDTLEGMFQAEDADWFPRAIAANALVRIAGRFPETYERVTAILRSALPDPDVEPDEDFDPTIWYSTVSDLCQLRDPQAYEWIGRLFDADLIDPIFIDRANYEEQYASTDPLFGEKPEPTDLISQYQAIQETRQRIERDHVPAPSRALGQSARR